MELRVPFTGFVKVFYQFQAAHDHIFGKEIWRLLPQLASSVASVSSAFYACSVCHGLAPDLGTLPVACTSRHRASKVPRVILKWLLNSSIVYASKIFS